MTFSTSIIRQQGIEGDKRKVYGRFNNNGGSCGGTISTGLHLTENFSIQYTGNATVADSPSVNETLPTDGTIVIVTPANSNGIWVATGL